MASFSYQHHPILVDSVFMANNNNNNFHEGICYTNNNNNNSSSTCFSQFHYPIMSDQVAQIISDVHGNVPISDQIYTISSKNNIISLSGDENELSSVTKKHSTDSSTVSVVDKLESSGDDEQVTQKVALPMEIKKRKSRNIIGSSSNSSHSKEARESTRRGKKQKSGKNNGQAIDHDINKEENKVKLNNSGKNDEVTNNNKGQQEPPSGYIHVRARRGQATDSHSLAERVRREKISERMKMLQRLVPGCEKVTGKALMLDEIINYVQSLQNQVEFLSMKLASLNPMFYDFGMDIDAFLVRPEGLNTLASQIPPVPQCSQSQPTAFTTQNNTNNYPTLMDNSASILVQQAQRPNIALSHENGSLLWDVEDQRQSFLNPSGFTNLCSFN